MPKTLSILHRVLVNHFYRINAGFFLFAFFVLFGLPYQPLSFHLSLITGIVQSQVFLLWVMLCWVLYNLKCVDYIAKQLRQPEQSFLFALNCLPLKIVYLYALWVHVQVYLPVLLYSVAIVAVALKKHLYLVAVEVVFFDLTLILATPVVYILALQRRTFFKSRSIFPSFSFQIKKPYFLYPLYFLFNDRIQMVLVTKGFSLLLLYGFIQLYEPEKYDIRPVQLCLLLVSASHCAIVYEVRLFEVDYLQFSKNLPWTITERFVKMTGMYTCLLLPEFILLIKGLELQFSLSDYPSLLLIIVVLLCLFHVVLLLEDITMEQLIRRVFAIIAGCFFIILYNPGIIFPAAMLLLCFALYKSYYYDYEKQYR